MKDSKTPKYSKLKMAHWKILNLALLIYDVLAVNAAFFLATFVSGVIQVVGITLLFRRMPISYYVFGIVIQFFAVLGIRFSYRFILKLRSLQERRVSEASAANAMVIGAGQAGQMIVRELHSSKELRTNVCCIIDDNPNKWDRYIDGVPVVGNRDDIMTAVKKITLTVSYLQFQAQVPKIKEKS